MLTPCPHEDLDTTETANGCVTEDEPPDLAAPEPEILDDGKPPF
jgi:hypothetical protein